MTVYKAGKAGERLKWSVFSALNRLADARQAGQGAPSVDYPVGGAENGARYIWVFCSTIGELNACKPLIEKLAGNGRLVLITDRSCYRDSYRQHFPEAVIVELTGQVSDGHFLCDLLTPQMLVVCEIPAKPNDAPCRLSYGMLRAAKNAGAKLFLVNGWLYEYQPSCRMDAIERRLFTSDYLGLFDFITVQNAAVRDSLVAAGAPADLIAITGNMKFDGLKDARIKVNGNDSEAAIQRLRELDSKIVVAGCLAGMEESHKLFRVFRTLKDKAPDIVFVVAPRHPENQEFMQGFTLGLEQAELSYLKKSELCINQLDADKVLILDTFGELKSFYSVADVCYVGCNHNVLEPLSFGRPTVVSGDWNEMYPSFPVYCLTKERDLICEASDEAQLLAQFGALLQQTPNASQDRILNELDELSGSVEANLHYLGMR